MRKIKLPGLQPWQSDAFDKVRLLKNSGKTCVIKSPRQIGKSYFLKYVLLYYALSFPNTVSILLEPVSYMSRRIHRELNKAMKPTKLVESSNLTDGFMIFKNGSEIHFRSAEQGENLRDATVSGIFVIDEASFITDEIFEITMPYCNVHRAPKLIVSTPLFKQGFFYSEFTDDENVCFNWNRKDYDFSLFLSEEDYARYKKKYTRQKFNTEILGGFIESFSTVFGDFKRCICKPLDMTPAYGGLDWGAGRGKDETCLTLLNKDGQIVYRWATADDDPNTQLKQLASIINMYPSLKYIGVEINSIGNVYFSILRKLVKNTSILYSFDTTNESKREMTEKLVLAFENRTIGIDIDPMLHSQLAGFEFKKLKRGYTYGNDTDERHDDRVLSLMFAWYVMHITATFTIAFSKNNDK